MAGLSRVSCGHHEPSSDPGIEVLNEPRLSADFSMAYLKSLYSRAASVIQGPNVTVHGKSGFKSSTNL